MINLRLNSNQFKEILKTKKDWRSSERLLTKNGKELQSLKMTMKKLMIRLNFSEMASHQTMLNKVVLVTATSLQH